MANTSPRRSALKSPNSSKRSFLSVSFEDQDSPPSASNTSRSSSRLSFSALTTPISHWSLKSSPSLKTGVSDDSSSADGLSIEEITCLDVDDILPKTDYTYARTASYSPKYLRRKRYISPNMSRRRIDGPEATFVSDEDDSDKEFEDEDIVLRTSDNAYLKNHSDKLGDMINSERQSRSRRRSKIVTSSPWTHKDHRISTHDHYYDGMLLRSGSHVKGSRKGLRQSSSISSDGSYINRSPVLAPTYRSDMDDGESHHRSKKIVTTVTTTTTDTSFDDDNEDEMYFDDLAEFKLTGKSKRSLQRDSEAYQKSQDYEDSEMKLHIDETETEKAKGRSHIRLRHLDGLDYEEDISDVDDIGINYHSRRNLAYRKTSTLSRMSSFFIMIVTTITTTITESTKQVFSPVATAAVSTVTSPVRWMKRAIISTCSWILWNSSSVLLLDIEAKQRRRRGCCCCLLPLLLLLPWALLAGYYSGPVKEQVGSYLTASESMISSYWASMWIKQPAPVFVTPPKHSDPDVNYQVDMVKLDQHIHQTILQVLSQQPSKEPKGLTQEQVEAIVRAILASQLDTTQKKFDGDLGSLNGVLSQDISNIRATLGGLQKDIHESDKYAKVIAGDLNAAKVSFESLNQEQRTEWLGIAEMLERKLLDMRNEVNELTNQNLALTALLKSCCQNNSMIKEAVHSHLATFFSQIDKDKDSAALAGLISLFGNRYVDRDELDSKLAAVAAEITEKMGLALARQADEIQGIHAKTDDMSQQRVVSVTGNLDELTVKNIVEDALLKFSADGIGMPDFALESAGGSILNIRCSETFYRKTALISVFGLPLWYTSNSPRTVIQPSVHPGECWAFKGSAGFLVIQLSQPVQPTGFTLEHIPRTLAPFGNIDSAPKTFSVFGLIADDDLKGINLGNYTYLDTGRPIQHFPVQNRQPGVFKYVELRILSNYGNIEYTCIYRFRVHGLP